MDIEKIKILGAVLELPAKQHCQFSPFGPCFEVNGLDWQCYLAGSSKTAPRILIFSIAIGADFSFDIKSGFSIAPAFSLHNNFDIGSVPWVCICSDLKPLFETDMSDSSYSACNALKICTVLFWYQVGDSEPSSQYFSSFYILL